MNYWGVTTMVRFEIDDEVECVEAYANVRKGMTGKVVVVNGGFPPILVAWNDFEGIGHNGGGLLKDANGYWVYPKNITHINLNLLNE